MMDDLSSLKGEVTVVVVGTGTLRVFGDELRDFANWRTGLRRENSTVGRIWLVLPASC